MNILKTVFYKYSNLLFLTLLLITFNKVAANSDMKAMGDVQRVREMARHKGKHHEEFKQEDEDQKFRGVYYGYLPCDHCAGIKMTLSLKNRKNYLLVTQYAQASTKEFYDKGKYDWDEKNKRLTLVSRKKNKDDGTLLKGKQDQFTLLRSDKNKSREVHIH